MPEIDIFEDYDVISITNRRAIWDFLLGPHCTKSARSLRFRDISH